jgi:hypothetical protein
MIERPATDAMWFVILIAAAMVVASCVLDFSRLKSRKVVPTVTVSSARNT